MDLPPISTPDPALSTLVLDFVDPTDFACVGRAQVTYGDSGRAVHLFAASNIPAGSIAIFPIPPGAVPVAPRPSPSNDPVFTSFDS